MAFCGYRQNGGGMMSLAVANLSSEMKKWEINTFLKLIIGNMKGSLDQLSPYEGRAYISGP
ncbi:hypothetical protein V1520DRAFT_350696 [Lipomyces starkeyi]|uniref:Uncharacterized protein n=1 Tax=Lipomyces starkeyi NRRL Y-11557 TaxID=675824 RepID=A0A1E3Q6R5_LIPST|nr:hypothetical protein LIPSTDRAFT_71679 [Lipomyces starkeyi NRRL Y-11557]